MHKQDDSMDWVNWFLLLILAVLVVLYLMNLADSRSATLRAEIEQARTKQAAAEKDLDMLLSCFNGKGVLVAAGEHTRKRCKLVTVEVAASW